MYSRTRRLLAALAVLLGTLAGAAGCGHGATTYAPAAYGENGHCYYLDYPAEAVTLIHDGLCPSSWIPWPMPASWEADYAPYYDSPAWYDTYVPRANRTVYVHHITTYMHTHAAIIRQDASEARYRSSTGKTVSGTTVAAEVASHSVKFGGGARSKKSYGGGARSGGSSHSSTSHGSGSSHGHSTRSRGRH